MDKNWVGKWYKDDEKETLNIIYKENTYKLKMSFEISGYYNFEPNCFYEKDGFLFYEINDEVYRRIYKVELTDGKLNGSHTQQGKTVQIEYKKISDIPDDEEARYIPTHLYVPKLEKTRIEVLKEYKEYSDKLDNNQIEYSYSLYEEAPSVLQKYDYKKYIEKFNGILSDDVAFSILDFVCDHFRHNGNSGMPHSRTAEDIIDYCEKNDGKINCRGLAMLLAALLRMNGIKAAHITCKPYEDPFDDCHVVVDCELPSGKRIMLDPTYRLYLFDTSGNYVSLRRLREMLINDEPYTANETASYNGTGFDLNSHREYMTKNTFRFSRGDKSFNGCEDGRDSNKRTELIPLGYPVDNFNKEAKADFVYNDNEFWK